MKNRVKQLRTRLGLSQEELSNLSKIGRSTISNIETERYTPRVDVAIRISKALKRSVEEVFITDDRTEGDT